jgi:hypothetical protein
VEAFTSEVSEALDSRTGGADREGLENRMRALTSKTKLMNDIIQNCKFYGMER